MRQQNATLLKRIEQLEDEVARFKKNSHNSSKPPSSDIVKPKKPAVKPGRKKRKRGGQHGHKKFTRPSFEPDKMYKVIEHRARKYRDPITGEIHIAPLPDAVRKGCLAAAR